MVTIIIHVIMIPMIILMPCIHYNDGKGYSYQLILTSDKRIDGNVDYDEVTDPRRRKSSKGREETPEKKEAKNSGSKMHADGPLLS